MIAAELRGGSKPSLNEALGWIGSRVDDIYGANVGRLEDVWIDPGTGAPRWLLVKEGKFGGRTTLIPFEDATAGAGHVWVPYEREIVRTAPEIAPGAPLTQHVEATLRESLRGQRSGIDLAWHRSPRIGSARSSRRRSAASRARAWERRRFGSAARLRPVHRTCSARAAPIRRRRPSRRPPGTLSAGASPPGHSRPSARAAGSTRAARSAAGDRPAGLRTAPAGRPGTVRGSAAAA